MSATASTRAEAVAGLFYPADPEVLASLVDGYLAAAGRRSVQVASRAVIAPHAGYVYSGPVAGCALRQLIGGGDDGCPTIVVIGPSHHVAFDGIATSPAGRFRTPLGDVEVDRDAIDRLELLSGVFSGPAVHEPEHSIEVELPFLQRSFDAFRIVPLVVGRVAPSLVADALQMTFEGTHDSRLVVSSDLSHFLSDDAARRVDEETAARIESLAVDLDGRAACGAAAINGLTWLARRRGWAVERLRLANSGAVTGDRERVVGYGAFAVGEPSGSDPGTRASCDGVR